MPWRIIEPDPGDEEGPRTVWERVRYRWWLWKFMVGWRVRRGLPVAAKWVILVFVWLWLFPNMAAAIFYATAEDPANIPIPDHYGVLSSVAYVAGYTLGEFVWSWMVAAFAAVFLTWLVWARL